jgi:hypothetical protein
VRRAHWLSRNCKSESVHAAIWTDTETDQVRRPDGIIEHRLRFGWAAFQRTRAAGQWTAPEWTRYETFAGFWDLVERKARPKSRLYLFAHNWAFDGPVLSAFEELPSRGWKLQQAVIDSPPVILTWRKGQATLKMLDTLNWWRMPLARVGESLGLPKLKMPAKRASKEAWDTYARNDVEIIRRVMLEWLSFLQAFDLGTFGPTLASQAIRAFRHRFMDHQILIDDSTKALQLARAALHGGRTEAFRLGRVRGPVHCLDVNSMYPAVMAEHSFPTALRMFAKQVSMRELARWLESYSVVALVQLETTRRRFAHVHNKRLVFPVGRLRLALTTPDLRDALEHGEVRAIECAAVYEQAPIFARFVAELYGLRMTAAARGEKVRTWLLKILMNSLYGKFAQRGEVWETVQQTPDKRIASWTEWDAVERVAYRFRQFGGQVQQRSVEPEAHDSHPAIAGHITAFARTRLWDLIETAGQGSVFYVDTDSLFVSHKGLARLQGSIDETRLGALKYESRHEWLRVFGAKDYATPDKRVTKGVKASATWLSSNVVSQEQWASLPGLLSSGQLGAPTTRRVEKRLARIYEKGVVEPGGRVSPLYLADW